ncbi:unnamed protein product [Rotaria sp. Silwood1]|nr:unnamed protein product [Rotaria sp. Silwood1]
MGSSRGIDPIMFLIRLGHMYSAVHTSAFIMLKPNSDQYLAIDNYYPLHDNVSFSNRRALPPVPAYSITTYKSQGQTLNKVVIDLKLSYETDDIAAVYVPLSRLKRLIDLIILRHFDYKVLLIKPTKSQLAEMERPDKFYLESQMRFSQWF